MLSFLGKYWRMSPKEAIESVSLASPMNVRHLSAWQVIAPQLMGKGVRHATHTSAAHLCLEGGSISEVI